MFGVRTVREYLGLVMGMDLAVRGELLADLNEWSRTRGAYSNEHWSSFFQRSAPKGALPRRLRWVRKMLEEYFAETSS
jgi:hypothetical protein